jgi:hypothetical protein
MADPRPAAVGEYDYEARLVPNFDRRAWEIMRGLTAKERAVMAVRAFVADEKLDEEVRKTMPYEQREEYDKLVRRYERVNWNLLSWCGVWQQWGLRVVPPVRSAGGPRQA